jgi:hypothetical protein
MKIKKLNPGRSHFHAKSNLSFETLIISFDLLTMPPKAKSWTKDDDVRLAALFRRGHRNGGLDPKNLSKKYIEETVIAKFWPGKNYKSFRQTYVPKARAYSINQTLEGARRKYQRH